MEMVKVLMTHPAIELSDLSCGVEPLRLMLRSTEVVPEFYRHPMLNTAEEHKGEMVLAELARTHHSAEVLRSHFNELFVIRARRFPMDINAIDGNRKTLLHYAVEAGNIELVELILGYPDFVPYLGRAAAVLFAFFWLKSLSRSPTRLRPC
jgi:hypothetical protein